MKRLLAGVVLGCLATAAQDNPDRHLAAIAGPQSPNRQGLDALTIEQLMTRFRVPAVSIAVIHNFQIQLVQAWGFADAAK